MMGQRVAVEYQCDRCTTKWYEDFDLERKLPVKIPVSLALQLGERKVSFGVLCESCAKTCENYVNGIAKDLKKKPGAKKGSAAAPPSPRASRETPRRSPPGESIDSSG